MGEVLLLVNAEHVTIPDIRHRIRAPTFFRIEMLHDAQILTAVEVTLHAS